MSTIDFRELTLSDYDAFQALRALALDSTPEAFGATNEEEQSLLRQRFEATAQHTINFTLGAFEHDYLVGILGFIKQERQKSKHKGGIWGVFVRPNYRGKGLAAGLLNLAIDKAFQNPELLQINLSVGAENTAAIHLYERLGFVRYGLEKNALCINGRFVDELLMVKVR